MPGSLVLRVAHSTEAEVAIELRGELDRVTVPRLREAVAAASSIRDTVRLDLAGVDFIDSAGIQALVALTSEARRSGKALLLDNPSIHVRRIAQLTQTAAGLDLPA